MKKNNRLLLSHWEKTSQLYISRREPYCPTKQKLIEEKKGCTNKNYFSKFNFPFQCHSTAAGWDIDVKINRKGISKYFGL